MEPSPISGTPAPYGRACVNCSRAKSKCILLAAGRGCERCQRLKKDCRPSPSVRKRNGRSTSSKTAQLEAKLDSIVSLLQTSGPNAGLPADWEPTTSAPDSKQSSPFNTMRYGDMPSPPQSAASPSNSSIIDVCNTVVMSPKRAEQSIIDFRTNNLRFLPFLYIPPHVTAQQLRQEKPFLWLCIMAVSVPGYSKRDHLFMKITELIFREVFVDVLPTMDILQGLMTFISWTTYSKRPFLNFYVHVVMGIVCDLGINKAPPKDLSTMLAFKSATGDAVGDQEHNSSTRTLEERRIVLGAFLMTSSVALSMSRVDALRWNPHMEESLTILMEAKECPEDELLVTLVKIQLVMDKVHHARRDGDDQILSRIYIKSFQAQLDSVRTRVPVHLLRNETVVMYLENAELVIHEWAIQTPALPHSPELQRLESLCASLQAIKTWLEAWMSVPAETWHGLPFTLFFQLSRAIMNLFKLSTLEDPGWDRTMVRNTVNVLEVLDEIIINMTKCVDMVLEAGDADFSIFEKGVKMMTAIKQRWEPRLMEIWYPSMVSTGLPGDQVVPVPPATDLNMIPMNFDDAWMMEILGSM